MDLQIFSYRFFFSTEGEKWVAQVPMIWEESPVFSPLLFFWPSPTNLYWSLTESGYGQKPKEVFSSGILWVCFGFQVTWLHRAIVMLATGGHVSNPWGNRGQCTGLHEHVLEGMSSCAGWVTVPKGLQVATTWAGAKGESLHEPHMNSLETASET